MRETTENFIIRVGLLVALVVSGAFLASRFAHADMIDYGFKFTNAAQAQADATMLAGQYDGVNADWMQDHVISNLQCWRPSQDVTSGSPPVTTHNFLAGFFVIVSVDSSSPVSSALLNHAALQFALNRTRRENNQSFVVKNNIGGIITDIACQPLFQSSNPYPMGGFN